MRIPPRLKTAILLLVAIVMPTRLLLAQENPKPSDEPRPAVEVPRVPVASSETTADLSHYELVGVNGVRMPRATKSPAPRYPEGSQKPSTEKTIGLCLLVNERGGVDSVMVTHGKSPDLVEATSAAVKQWNFEPALKDGKPVPVRVDVTARFTGTDAIASVSDYYHVGCGITAPRPIKSPDPSYTKAARKAKIQGTVVLWLVVNAEGKPEHIKIQRSLDEGLDQNAAKAVERWRFEPAVGGGKPVSVMINVEVNYRLY